MENTTEDKKKGKSDKVKKCIRTAAGTSWEDPSLLEWESGTNCSLTPDEGHFKYQCHNNGDVKDMCLPKSGSGGSAASANVAKDCRDCRTAE